MKNTALVFDFDGTLVDGGMDKGIHIMYSAWVTCFENGLAQYLHTKSLEIDITRLLNAFLLYPGAPRFLQLKAIVCSLLGQQELDEAHLNLEPDAIKELFPKMKEKYNQLYSSLNEAAASRYWRPFTNCKKTLESLVDNCDLYIASGVPQKLLEMDLNRFGFNLILFKGVYGSDQRGGSDKGTILKKIQNSGYPDVLFIGDSTKDLEYAGQAGVPFFRIRQDSDFSRLQKAIIKGLPNEDQPWSLTEAEIALLRSKLTVLLEKYIRGQRFSPEEIVRLIHS